MYKKLSLLFLVLGTIVSVPFAKADVQDISFQFCDMERGLAGSRSFIVTPGKETEICITFTTSSETERNVIYGFTSGRVTPSGTPMCESDKGPNNPFSKLIPIQTERNFVISKNKPVTVKEKIMVPIGMSGTHYGCLAYSLATPTTGVGGMFNLVVNKTFPILLVLGINTETTYTTPTSEPTPVVTIKKAPTIIRNTRDILPKTRINIRTMNKYMR